MHTKPPSWVTVTGDEIEALAQRLARAVACAIMAGLACAVAGVAAGASYGWNVQRSRRDWRPFERELLQEASLN